VGIRLFVEVLKHAPEELTWRERYALTVLAENANDGTRECWPGIEDDPEIALRMRLPGRSSRYEVLKALRTKGALEGVSAGRRGRRAVYRIPVMGPGTTDAIDPRKGPGTKDPKNGKRPESPDPESGKAGPNRGAQRPETPDANGEKGSGNDGHRVRDPRTQGPETTDPFPSVPSGLPPQQVEPQQGGAPATPAAREITDEDKLDFGRFWQLHPKSRDMDKTRAEWVAAVIGGADPKRIAAAAEAYAHEVAGTEFRFVKQSLYWLRDRRYEDKFEPAPAPARKPPPLPPWCGECADGNRAAEREGHLRKVYDHRGNARPCPKCHPKQAAHAA
jgi:hypothetical protein